MTPNGLMLPTARLIPQENAHIISISHFVVFPCPYVWYLHPNNAKLNILNLPPPRYPIFCLLKLLHNNQQLCNRPSKENHFTDSP
jgi:hypothetical protein